MYNKRKTLQGPIEKKKFRARLFTNLPWKKDLLRPETTSHPSQYLNTSQCTRMDFFSSLRNKSFVIFSRWGAPRWLIDVAAGAALIVLYLISSHLLSIDPGAFLVRRSDQTFTLSFYFPCSLSVLLKNPWALEAACMHDSVVCFLVSRCVHEPGKAEWTLSSLSEGGRLYISAAGKVVLLYRIKLLSFKSQWAALCLIAVCILCVLGLNKAWNW